MQKIFLCILFLVAFFRGNAFAQSVFQLAFGGIYVDDGRCIRQTSDSGFIMTGSMDSVNVSQNPLLIKIAANGDTLFTEALIGYTSANGTSVDQTTDGGFVVAGSIGPDFQLTRTDSIGNTIWSKLYGGPVLDILFDMQLLNNGGIIMCGLTSSFGVGNDDALVIRTDGNGDTIWSKSYGALLNERASSIFQTTDNGFIFCGSINDSVTGLSNFLLVKIDSAGNQLWSRAYGSPEEDKAFSVIETQDGSYLIAGLTRGFRPWGDFSMYLMKTDSLGNLIWSRIYNASTQILTDAIREVIQLTDGNYAFAGYSSTALMLASITKTDTSGNPIWSMNYGSQHDIGVGLQETKDGGFAMIGYGYEGLVGYDLFFVKTDSIGNSSCNQYVNNLITSAPATQTGVAHITSGYAPVSISNIQVTTSKGITGVDPCIFSNVASADATDEINIYPNPASWMITVSIPAELKDVSIELYNILGEQLQKILPHQTFEVTLDVSGFASGLYFIKITGNNSAQWKRLLIE